MTAAPAVVVPVPTRALLAHSVAVFRGYPGVDRAYTEFLRATAPGPDLARADHRRRLHRLLNSWGCRLRYPRDGEPPLLDAAIDAWWAAFGAALPTGPLRLAADDDLATFGVAYAVLAGAAAGPSRTLGATAAAKALYALRPHAVMPWDAAIAAALHGGRDGVSFTRHLALGRDWAAAVVAELGVGDDDAPALLGRPEVTLAKILDEYAYVAITLNGG